MKQKTKETFLLTMLSAIMLAGSMISVPDSKPAEPAPSSAQSSEREDFCGESGINPLSDLDEINLT